jgi:hypothetical protein
MMILNGYMISFAVTFRNGFSFSNRIVKSDQMPTSAEIRAMEIDIRDTHPAGGISAVALNVVPLEH